MAQKSKKAAKGCPAAQQKTNVDRISITRKAQCFKDVKPSTRAYPEGKCSCGKGEYQKKVPQHMRCDPGQGTHSRDNNGRPICQNEPPRIIGSYRKCKASKGKGRCGIPR